jgi:capsular exopolysaccharide synthesis family protein
MPYLRFAPWVALSCVLALLLGVAYLSFAPRIYSAQALLKLSGKSRPVGALSKDDAQGALESSGAMETYVEEARSLNVALRAAHALDAASLPGNEGLSPLALAEELRACVEVRSYRTSNLILIQARAASPRQAAELANAWSAAFIEANLELERKEAQAVHQFIQEQLAQVLSHLVHSQQLLKAFSGNREALDRDLQGRIGVLKTRIGSLEAEKAGLSARYNSGHPALQRAQNELSDSQAELQRLLERSGNAGWLNLVEEIKVLESTTSWLLQKQQEATIAAHVNASNILVVDSAMEPDGPAYPRKRRVLVNSLALGLLLGLGACWLALRLGAWVGKGEQLAEATRLPYLGGLSDFRLEQAPWWRLRSAAAALGPAALYVHPRRDGGRLGKEVLGLRNSLLLQLGGTQSACVAPLSLKRGEGRTLLSANLGLALSRMGKRVLLLDGNLAHPGLPQILGVEPGKRGLGQLLEGRPGMAKPILDTPYAGLQLLPAGGDFLGSPDELLSPSRLKLLLESLKGQFDYIVLDTPPLDSPGLAAALGSCLDGALLMAEAGSSRLPALSRAAGWLKDAKAPVLGCVINKLDPRLERSKRELGSLSPLAAG